MVWRPGGFLYKSMFPVILSDLIHMLTTNKTHLCHNSVCKHTHSGIFSSNTSLCFRLEQDSASSMANRIDQQLHLATSTV